MILILPLMVSESIPLIVDHKFRIVQFTDVHIGNNDRTIDTVHLMSSILDIELPNMAILTGDVVTGDDLQGDLFRPAWEFATRPMRQHNIPWAVAIGNHDMKGTLDQTDIIALDQSYQGSLTQSWPYMVSLFIGSKMVAGLVMLDITNGPCVGYIGEPCVPSTSVEWLRHTAQQLGHIPLFLFFHVPIPQFVDVYRQMPTAGQELETVKCPLVDTGLYDVAMEHNVVAMFVGHDHLNDWCGQTKSKITLCYGRKTGHGFYSPTVLGARIIEIKYNQSHGLTWSTWIREENGNIANQIAHDPSDHSGIDQTRCGDFWIRLVNELPWILAIILFVATIIIGLLIWICRCRKRKCLQLCLI
jgi:hypothetical protein